MNEGRKFDSGTNHSQEYLNNNIFPSQKQSIPFEQKYLWE